MKKICVILLLASGLSAIAQAVGASISRGNEFYRQSLFDLAEREYRNALRSDPANQTALYNLANTLQKQKRYEEAVEVLKKLAALEPEGSLKPATYYNTGVGYTKQRKLEESIEAYKEALRNDPDDKEARENLQKALQQKRQQQQQQSQQNQKSSGMSQSEAERKLQQLHEKEKRLNQRLQNRQGGRPQPQDW